MRAHGGTAAVQQSGCDVLACLADAKPVILAVCIDSTRAIREAGGIDVVVSALRGPARVPAVQRAACGAIAALARHEDSRAAIRTAGGLTEVVSSMQRHHDGDGVPLEVASDVAARQCATVAVLGLDPENVAQLTASGAVAAVLDTMRRHADSAAVQAPACTALACVARGVAANQVAICDAGGVDAVVRAMRSHAAAAAVQQAALAALWELSYCDASKPLMVAVGAMEVLRAAKRRYWSQPAHAHAVTADRLLIWAGGLGAMFA
jgi:hypothetical protein